MFNYSFQGWMYEPEDTISEDLTKPSDLGFYGIIVDRVLDEARK